MHHIYPGGKGDPLCPLGFHPQVRWPTRCKRCFRDYKEHGGKGKDEGLSVKEDMTRSTPSLSISNSNSSRGRDDSTSSPANPSGVAPKYSAFNSNRLSNSSFSSTKSLSSSSSWTSTPDLGNSNDVSTTVSVTLPRRRRTSDLSNNIDSLTKTAEFTIRKRTYTTDLSQINVDNETEERAKSRSWLNSESKAVKGKTSVVSNDTDSELKSAGRKSGGDVKKGTSGKPPGKLKKPMINEFGQEGQLNPDVEFILRVKSSNENSNKKTNNVVKEGEGEEEEEEGDAGSVAETETTETTLVGKNESELLEEVESLRNELESVKARCERVEREKSDILLRRLASFDTASSKTAACEVLKLQKKVNELCSQSEDLRDDNKSLCLKVKELEKELEEQKRTSEAVRRAEELQAKLAAAETLCEELMDENEEMKKELRELEDEIEEMQDNFREDQADEYSSLKKELEQTTKNCRILSFKLRKSERKAEQLENEKLEAELKYKEVSDRNGVNSVEKIKNLEGDLKAANEMAARLTKELEEANKRLKTFQTKNDSSKSTAAVTKLPAGEKVSRASLIRGGSQEDPQQLLRDLQDSLEREADLREQLRFAEEEAANLRKKAARVEEDNDSLALQLKKMATKAKTARRSSPCTSTRTPRPAVEKDEVVSDEEDPTELKVLLELNEQEAAVLRKKVEELEADSELNRKKVRELEEKLSEAGSGKKFGGSSANARLADKEKVRVGEQEVDELRKKVMEKDREIKRLEEELELRQKKPRGQLVKSQSLDSPTEQKALDLGRQLQLVEQEAAILRTKISTLENENENLIAENKKLQLLRATKKSAASSEGARENISTSDSRRPEYENQVTKLKEKAEKGEKEEKSSSVSAAGKPLEVEKLKKEVKSKTEELEKVTKDKQKLEKTLRRLREDATVDAVKYYKTRKPKKPTDLTTKLQLKKMVEDLENEIGDVLVVLKRSESEKLSSGTVEEQRGKVEGVEEEKKKWSMMENEISVLSKKLEEAEKELEEERGKAKKVKKQSENLKKLEEEKSEIEKEVLEKRGTVTELRRKLTEMEEKLEKTEKELCVSKGKVSRLEKCVQELEESKAKKEKKCKSVEDELSEMRKSNLWMKNRISELESEVKKGKEVVRNLEESIRKEREKATDECLKAGSAEKKEITALREDLSKKRKELDELNEKCEKLEEGKRRSEEDVKKMEAEMSCWKEKTSGLERELKWERKKGEEMKESQEKEVKNREAEVSRLKAKMKVLEQTSESWRKKMEELKGEWTGKCEELESEVEAKRRKYEELTAKYELLEEEHVVTKAQLVMEKERAESEAGMLKKEVAGLEVSLRGLKESLASKEEGWGKERKEVQERAARASEAKWELERAKLQAVNEEHKSLTEQLKQQNEAVVEQMGRMRKENEELRKKLDDFDKVSKIQRQMSADTNQLGLELREVRGKLAAEEKNHKSEMESLKLRYEGRVKLISEELERSQNQVSRFKRERDTYKHMVEEAQVQMADLKKEGQRRNSLSDGESKDSKALVAGLEQQVSCMEDELSEARLECSKLKTEFVSEKSGWEVKLSELQSRVNELEEEKILSSGRTKVAGLRTKMELAWQKEREDQQRLLQETSTLARDLRQTLYEVERERDKERLESKRRQEQMKRTCEEEMEENRRKVTELQCDLLELRDAHAKLRTTNEKLRREKEKWDKESRMVQRWRVRNEEEERKISVLLDNIDLLLKASFEKKNSGKFSDWKKRGKSKSRESSPLSGPQDESFPEIQLILQRLNDTAEEIRARKQEEERDEDRTGRASSIGFRRAASTESDTILESSKPVRRAIQRKNTLYRKSLSLSETAGPGAQEQVIWREEGNGGSLSSLEERGSCRYKSLGPRENSMDSRLSGGSTQSEVISGEKKKKKSFFGKLKKLGKSRSIEDPTSSQEDVLRGGGESDSDVSTASDFKGSKKDLKEKIAGIFTKDSSSKANSLEHLRKSEERKIKTLPRKSAEGAAGPPPSVPPKSSTLGRPLDKAKNPAASLLNKS